MSDERDADPRPADSEEEIERAARALIRAREAWHSERGEAPPEGADDQFNDAARVFIAEREAWFRERSRAERAMRDGARPGEGS